jgi:non-canonical (house-cleaning) NTP pyrophosphatase
MNILLTSENHAKKLALQNVIKKFYDECSITTLSVDSCVSKTPTSDDEAIRGCFNRIEQARQIKNDFDAYVSFEGMVSKNDFGTFLYGWCLFVNGKTNEYSLGASAQVMIPKFISEKISSQEEFSDVVKMHYKSPHIGEMPIIGSNGLFTNLAYTRVNEFEDAAMCALGYFHNSINTGYDKEIINQT